MRITIHHLLKALAVIGFFSCFYPFFVVFSVYGTGTIVGSGIWYTVFVALGLCGYVVQSSLLRLEHRHKISIPLRKLLFLACGLVIAALLLVLITQSPLALKILLIISLAAGFLMGGKIVVTEYRNLMGDHTILFAIAVDLITIFLLFYGGLGKTFTYHYRGYIGLFFVLTICYFIVKNQGNIDYLMERRRHSFSHLPKRIRYYNIALLSIILVVLFSVFLLRDQLVALLYRIKDLLVTCGLMIVRAILWFFSLFAGEGEIGTESMGQAQINDGVVESAMNIDWTILALCCIAVVIIVYRKHIWRAIRELFQKIWRKIATWLHREDVLRKRADNQTYYYDKVEAIETKPQKKMDTASYRQLKKEWKQYQQMPKDVARYRYGYGLVQSWFQLAGIEVCPGDTVFVMYEKARGELSLAEFQEVTNTYSKVRYAEQFCRETSFDAMDLVLREIITKLARKKSRK